MDINTDYIKVQRTARLSTYGNLTSKTKYFWMALHGSNMTSEQVLYKYRDFDPDQHFVVAPEGLSKFYAKGFAGDVLAIWMTKRDRQLEINDFSYYLSEVYKKYVALLPADCVKIGLGFSQGGTTLFRWLHRKKVIFDHLIGYSCSIPEDINLKESATPLREAHIVYTYGLQDQYLSHFRVNELEELLTKNELSVDILPYSGDHRIDRNQLKSIFEAQILQHPIS